MQQEPMVMWSCIIGTIGVAIPLVVPEIRESMGSGNTGPPPTAEQIARAMLDRNKES
eukprot:CAMPEP_0197854514 /NCGR_PEP_ID=MMETSP1438-20131217/24819_1 /TAXON_ID=1461541 /ORGANISM="Pterosperma sp., Strain CCMP1384" /LENGTH=56 /DNA_ID=CAMNT_0043469279 /DNA_START=165 /DNA_END=338 /DNA_ORIENTATION=-